MHFLAASCIASAQILHCFLPGRSALGEKAAGLFVFPEVSLTYQLPCAPMGITLKREHFLDGMRRH